MPDSPLPPSVDAAVLFSTAGFGEGFADRLTSTRRYEGSGVEYLTGRLSGKAVVCVWPTGASVPWSRLVNSVVAAHHPCCFLAAGVAEKADGDTALIGTHAVNEARGPAGETIRLAPPRMPAGAKALTIGCSDAGTPADAYADWVYAIASACLEGNLPCMALALVESDPLASDDPEWKNLAQQKSLAGRFGAAVGGLWRRPTLANEAWDRLRDRWKRQEQLAEWIQRVLEALPGENESLDSLTPERR